VPRSGKLSLRPLPPPRDRLVTAIPCESAAVLPTTVVSVAPAAIADDAVVSAALLPLISSDPRPSGDVSFAIGIARVPSRSPTPLPRAAESGGREAEQLGRVRAHSFARRLAAGRAHCFVCVCPACPDPDVALMRLDPVAPQSSGPQSRGTLVRTQPAVVCCVRAVPGACSVRVMGSRVQAGSRDLHSCKMYIHAAVDHVRVTHKIKWCIRTAQHF
jgi:hypothetical protein